MSYCTIDEAWENSNGMKKMIDNIQRNQQLIPNFYNGPSNQSKPIYENFDSYFQDTDIQPEEDSIMEHFEPPPKKKVTFKKEIEHFTPDIEIERNNCEEILQHLNNCKLCKSRIKEHFGSSNIINKYIDNETKQLIIIILIGLFIVILLDLFFSLGKSISFRKIN